MDTPAKAINTDDEDYYISEKLEYCTMAVSNFAKTITKLGTSTNFEGEAFNMWANFVMYYKLHKPYRLDETNLIDNISILSLMYIALLRSEEPLGVSDLIRFEREARISFNVLNDNISFNQIEIRRKSAELVNLLKVYIPSRDIYKLCRIYCKELNLPEDFKDRAIAYISSTNPCMKFTPNKTKTIPNYEARAMSFIMYTMKLLYGLDDKSEMELSTFAHKVNNLSRTVSRNNESKMYKRVKFEMSKSRAFSWSKWKTFILYRRNILQQYYFPFCDTKINLSKDDVDAYIRFLQHAKRKMKRDRPTVENPLLPEPQRLRDKFHQDHPNAEKGTDSAQDKYFHFCMPSTSFYNCGTADDAMNSVANAQEKLQRFAEKICDKSKKALKHLLNLNLAYPITLTPYHTYTQEIIKNEAIRCDRNSLKLTFTNDSLEYLLSLDYFRMINKNQCRWPVHHGGANIRMNFPSKEILPKPHRTGGTVAVLVEEFQSNGRQRKSTEEDRINLRTRMKNYEAIRKFNKQNETFFADSLRALKKRSVLKHSDVCDCKERKRIKMRMKCIKKREYRAMKKASKNRNRALVASDTAVVPENNPQTANTSKQQELQLPNNDTNKSKKEYKTHYLPFQRYWVRHQDVTKLDGHSYEQFEKTLPHSFRFVLTECAKIIGQSNQELYAEFAIVEWYMVYVYHRSNNDEGTNFRQFPEHLLNYTKENW